MALWAGIVFGLSLALTAWIGYFGILFQSLLFLPFSYSIYRGYTDLVAEFWLVLPGTIIEFFGGTRFVFAGETEFEKGDKSLIIMNHRTRLDWMFLWNWMTRFGRLRNHKIILKEGLKFAPGFGWAMQNFSFLFLKRDWTVDQGYFTRMLNYFVSRDYPIQMLLFPEGTDLSKSNKEKSLAFAKQNGLEEYHNVLHPRTKGFIYTVQLLRGNIDSIYDMTVGYPDFVPESETAMFKGLFPKEIHFHCKRYPISEIPTEEKALEKWCNDRWREKEALLDKFNRDKKFPETKSQAQVDKSAPNARFQQIFTITAWFSLMMFLFYCLYSSSLARWYFLLGNITMFALSKIFGGTEILESGFFTIPSKVPKPKSQ